MRHLIFVFVFFLSSCSLFSPSYENLSDKSQWRYFQNNVSNETGWLVFGDTDSPTTAFVFYPGGKVNSESYGHFANTLAEQLDILVITTPMPLDLAVFGAKRATKVQKYFPTVKAWIIGGHSLGGTMAASLAYKQSLNWQGLVLLASYPQDKHDFSQRDLAAISIIGNRDGLISPERWLQSLTLLPVDADSLSIIGGNHAGFGTYGAQENDNEGTINNDEQQRQTIAAIIHWVNQNFE